jgi:glycosyltransferase involved in cell wall biosynthesis
MPPTVSVVVTTYNQAGFIGETLEGVFAQTFPDYEVIVVDDGSTDDTPDRIRPFLNRITYLRQKNQGIASSRNAGISLASGEFVALLDGDDLWLRDKLSLQVAAARQFPNAGLIVVDGVMFSSEGILRSSLFDRRVMEPGPGPLAHKFVHSLLVEANAFMTTSQVMIPRCVLLDIGPSNSKFIRGSDYDLYLRIAYRYDAMLIKKILVKHRYVPTSASGPLAQRPFIYFEEDLNVLRAHMRRVMPSDRPLVERVYGKKLQEGARRLYDFGRGGGRRKAFYRLIRLVIRKHITPGVFAFLLALCLPQRAVTVSRAACKRVHRCFLAS